MKTFKDTTYRRFLFISIPTLMLVGCSLGASTTNQTGGESISGNDGTIQGKVINVSGYDDVSISLSKIINSSTLSQAPAHATDIATIIPDSNGEFRIGVEHGCYHLTINKSKYRSRAIQRICIDHTTPSKDLGNIGLSVERRFIMTTSIGDTVIMAGGETSEWYTATVDILDVKTGSLTIENLSRQRGRGAATSLGERAYFAGGEECENGNCAVSSLVEIYDAVSKTWSSTNLSEARAELSAATTSDGYVVFAGGFTQSATSNRVDILNTTTGLWTTTTLPVARYGMAAVAAGTKIYFAGGSTNISGTTKTNRVDIFEPSSGTWTTQSLSVARRNFAAVKVGNKLLFGGGQTHCFPCGTSNVADIFDLSNGTWSTANLSLARELLVASTDGNIAIFAGGEDNTNGRESDVVDIYDSSTNSWSTATLSQARTNLSVVTAGGKAYFIGGNFGIRSFSNVIDVFDFTTKSFSNSLF